MTNIPSAPRSKAAGHLKSFTLKGVFVAGMLFVASPALAQNGNPDPGDNNEGCGVGAGGVEEGSTNDVGTDFEGNGSGNCRNGVPAPLAAAGIPALALLGGGFIALRKRRRDSNAKK